jgi:hypothetical protein
MANTSLRVVLTAALLAIAVDGSAQERSGLIGGVSVGAGVLDIHGKGEPGAARNSRVGVVSFDARLGGMVAPKTALRSTTAPHRWAHGLDRGLGVALLGSAGVEFYRRGTFAADIQFHFTGVILDGVFVDSPAVRFGVNWY